MKRLPRLSFTTCLLVFATSLPAEYRITGTISIGGTGGWDYLTADDHTGRVNVSHTTEVDIIDLRTQKIVGTISGLTRVHGIAIANDLGSGFISDGGADEVVSFNLKTLAIKNRIEAGTNPDGIVYDSFSKRVFAFNGRSQNVTVIDAAGDKVAATITLQGKPEFPVSDGRGSVYDNIEDKSEIVRIDTRDLNVKSNWSIAPCEGPSGLAIDKKARRLFSVCHNKLMAVVDADSGKVVATPAIGEGPDAASYDPKTKYAFSSNGDGTLTVVQQSDNHSYSVRQNASTAEGARTMTLDPATHRIYLAAAEYGPAPAATAENPHPRKSVLPGTFKLVVLSDTKTK